MFDHGTYLSLRWQAAWRVLVTLLLVIVLIGSFAWWFEYTTMNLLARHHQNHLTTFYQKRIQSWEQEWQERSIRFRARIEFAHILEDSQKRWDNLRAFLTIVENTNIFTQVLLINPQGEVLFRHVEESLTFPEKWSTPDQPLQWFFDARTNRLFRVYSQAIFMGRAEKGFILLFRPLDNALLNQIGFPQTEMFLTWRQKIIASSLDGEVDDHTDLHTKTMYWKHGMRHDQGSILWSEELIEQPTLVFIQISVPLLSVQGVLIASGTVFLSVVVLLWLTLGLWLNYVTRRIEMLKNIAHEFTVYAELSPESATLLTSMEKTRRDEMGELAQALGHLTQTVRLNSQAQRAYAEKLQVRDEQFHAMTQALGVAILVFDSKGNIIFWNQKMADLFGQSYSKVAGQNIAQYLIQTTPTDNSWRQLLKLPISDTQTTSSAWQVATSLKRRDGSQFPAEITLSYYKNDKQFIFTAAVDDMTQRYALEARDFHAYVNRIAISALLEIALEDLPLQRKLEVALSIILTVPWLAVQKKGSIFLVEADGKHLEMIAQQGLDEHLLTSCQHLPFGYCLCGRAAQERRIVFTSHLDAHHDIGFDGIQDHGHYCLPILSRDTLLGVLNLYVKPNHVYNQEEEAFLNTATNTLAELIERGQSEEKIKHMAGHDNLTGLPNRRLLQELLLKALQQAERDRLLVGIFFMDLDRFKQVNDTFGHDVGDILLIQSVERIQSCLRKADIVARLGGDEFNVILPDLHHPQDAGKVADQIIQQLHKEFMINGHTLSIGVSIGISIFPTDGTTIDELIKQADLAMYKAKEAGRGVYRFASANIFVPEK
ncbi:MAG: diguanylate cyclase [Magnetococcus sp. DMHC-6]